MSIYCSHGNDRASADSKCSELAKAHFAIALMKADGSVSSLERMKVQKHTSIDISIVEQILHARDMQYMDSRLHVELGFELFAALWRSGHCSSEYVDTLLHDLEKISEINGHTEKETRLLEYIREKMNDEHSSE